MNCEEASSAPAILIIDDQAGIRRMLEILFQKESFRVATAGGGTELKAILDSFQPDVVITDVRMEPVSGIEVLRLVRNLRPATPVILMTAFGTIATAVEAMKLGAVDFITKPFKNEDLLLKVERLLEGRTTASPDQVRPARSSAVESPVARSPAMKSVIDQAHKVAGSNLTVLITGETGTGKSMIANDIHRHSRHAAGPFITVNAAALPEPLLESELFGHEKGAFTGASSSHAGLFEAAEGGTLFLDEIGTLPAVLQSKLLGVLQDRQVRRVGGNRIITVNVRIVAATNLDLEQAVERGEFRQDLYYRLNVARIRMPALREHREDLPFILKAMLAEFAAGKPHPYAVSPEALSLLQSYPFPGNVRELRNVVEWAVTVAEGAILRAEDLPEVVRRHAESPLSEPGAASGSMADMERDQIVRTIQRLGGNLAEVARTLGIGRTTLWRKMREYGIRK
jgi:DNA-binding NtrC family response regulator